MAVRVVVVGIFRDPDQARDAISALKDAGFSGGDISVLMPDRGDTARMAEETASEAATGAAAGALTGGILGGLAGWLVGIGSLAIPGVGPFIAAGVLATTLGGAAIGAGVGAIAGALIGMGVPEEEANWYENEVRGGGTLVAVRPGARDDEAEDILHDYGAYDVEHRDAAAYRGGSRFTSGVTTPEASAPITTVGSSGLGWDTEMPRFRSSWQSRYGSTGGRWEDEEPSYRYGWEMASDPRYRGRSWSEVELDLRRDYEVRYPGSTWEQVKESIREAWDSVTGSRRS
jgi:hypothetical protein